MEHVIGRTLTKMQITHKTGKFLVVERVIGRTLLKKNADCTQE